MSNRIIESFYTDGACLGNPGPGGWGLVINFVDGSVVEIGGAEEQTTNNRMEMQAAIAALKVLDAARQSNPVTLYTDSEYVKKGITQWISGWKKKGWKTSKGEAVSNQDLWQSLDRLNSNLITWKYVRGHSGNPGNERADAIASAFASGTSPSLQQAFPSNLEVALQEISDPNVAGLSDKTAPTTIAYKEKQSSVLTAEQTMTESLANNVLEDLNLPRELRVTQLRGLIESLRIADEIASKGYLISSSELADLMDVNASAVTSRGDHWPWRNWVVSRVRREGNQILWQLERVD
ncbi:ribonuclease HI [Lusitaniella coriacea LEGE 07157]|uniref:Ribonuclease H n=1 Tax=Lusitaniella coriacea LEGE 07157 TaxID=945747 RepID=A0A8J7IU96_9CYAN|nr:ribonuclease HI [Lusitaniella coriacea]MBE9117377.1 ribonuclease HI [Lusitaniella coriacea LEGE 07157]